MRKVRHIRNNVQNEHHLNDSFLQNRDVYDRIKERPNRNGTLLKNTVPQHLKAIKSLRPLLLNKKLGGWSDQRLLTTAMNNVELHFDMQLKAFEKSTTFMFEADKTMDQRTRDTVDLLRSWHLGEPISLSAMVCASIDAMGLKLDSDIYQATLLASLLGEVENSVPYHNNMHFRKVLLQLIRLVVMHNRLFAGTPREISDENVALMMLAACIHDLGHDGTGNMVRGVFKQSRLEQNSINIIGSYLNELGFGHQDTRMDAIRIMILATDVTPINDPGNPVGQTKAAYRFHFLGDNKKVDSLHLAKEMLPLQNNEILTTMALLLHEADVATSAGLTYEITQFETIMYREEICADEARPQHIIDFMDNICQRQFVTNAGQNLFGANFAKIYAQVKGGISQGNHGFGTTSKNPFILDQLISASDVTTHH